MLRSRGDRRRRALAEEGQRDQLEAADLPVRDGDPPLYSSHARHLADMRLRDLIPRKVGSIAALFVSGVVLIAGILAGEVWRENIAAWLDVTTVPAIDLQSATNLSHAYVALSMATCTLLSLFVFGLRRYRLDDYRGHYRLWFACSMLLALVTASSFAPVHQLWNALMIRCTGWSHDTFAHLWWSGPLVVAQLAVAIRLAMELRRCNFALGCLIASQTLLAFVFLVHAGVLKLSSPQILLWQQGSHMLGVLVMELGLMVYVRQILLEIDGVIKPVKIAPRVKKQKSKTIEHKEKTLRIDSAHSHISEPVVEKHVESRYQSDDDDNSEDADESNQSSSRKMSRADRKALRKQQKAGKGRDSDWE